MAKKKLLSVGFDFPGGLVEYIAPDDKRSLTDGDIILVTPNITPIYGYHTSDKYKGKPSLTDNDSFKVKECVHHWNKEISDAMQAGKTVLVFLNEVQEVFVDTGRREYSGTGRNRQTTRIVEELNNYEMLPVSVNFSSSKGRSMRLADNATILSSYWTEFSDSSEYRVYIQGKLSQQLVLSRDKSRVLGGIIRYESSPGMLILLPYLKLDYDELTEDTDEGQCWNEKAAEIGNRLISQIIEIDKTLHSIIERTPIPDWVKASEYVLDKESKLQDDLLVVEDKIGKLQTKKDELKISIVRESASKRLLYEKGPQLEEAVIEALSFLGFKIERFRDSESEFDVVFEFNKGRFIGEAEGKDNKPINIDKLRQLDMNIHEDLSRDTVNEPAKGVLFGNASRLSPISERKEFFTPKCISAAKRSGVALVCTSDLFFITKYLKTKDDKTYAAKCRKAIFDAKGEIVKFPSTPATSKTSPIASKTKQNNNDT